MAMSSTSGKVYLVGAGPGDPGLLTLRGAECLRLADVILYDYLASPQLLAHAPQRAERICLGRHGHGRIMRQEEINQLMIRKARAGLAVVRLKGGDPAIFARMGEERSALREAGIDYEIVPGITAAQAASSHAEIPLTHRDDASCVALVTGHEMAGKSADAALDFRALARFPGTLVFYMGITTAPSWTQALIDHGKRATTPVAVVRRCTWPDQQTLYATLGDLSQLLTERKIRPPALVIVGDVARASDQVSWFARRPLFGRSILVTRPLEQAPPLANQLRDLGAEVIIQPAIEIAPPRDWTHLDAAIERLTDFDWLVFLSANGVHHFLRRLHDLGHDLRRLGGLRLATIGPGTTDALHAYHLNADLQPATYRAEALAEVLCPQAREKKVLIARASRGREVLADALRSAGAEIEQVVVYESRDVKTPADDVAEALARGKIDWITVTSSAIARSLVGLFGAALRQARLAAISPLTAEVLTELGHAPAIVAKDYTTGGIVSAILAAEQGNS